MATTMTWTGERKKSNDCLMELAFGASGGGGSASAGNQTSGAQKTQVVNSSGVSMPGDATNGFDVDVTRLSALVAGAALIGKVGIDQTTPGTTNLVSAAQSGTWTVQPGNTANTTAWKVDGSAVTQPVSIATAPVLVAGSALIGKVGIDQTTPGTTNAVAIKIVQGAANVASSQVTASTSAATLAVARATRRKISIKNTDTSITVYVGPATVTAANGMPIKAGESFAPTWVGLIQVIAASGSPVVSIWDEYD